MKQFELRKSDPKVFLKLNYSMRVSLVRGRNGPDSKLYYKGLPLMPRQEYVDTYLMDPEFLRLYRDWQLSGFEKRLTPTPDRIDSEEGYLVKNIEWVTHSENCRRAAEKRWSFAA